MTVGQEDSRPDRVELVRRLLREPLVHFLVLGGLLFAYYDWRGSSGPGSTRIVVTRGQIEHLASGFVRTWQRPPSEAELKGLVDDYVKEEIAVREAAAMGLDRDDTVVRRRLRLKLEFLADEAIDRVPPTDVQLQQWLDAHRGNYQAESRVALRQVFLSTEQRGAATQADAEKLLEKLRASRSDAAIDSLGDPSMLPRDVPLGSASEVARDFGADFAREVVALTTGRWSGPVKSPYGLHLVLVTERTAAAAPELAEIRPLVERDFMAERRKAQLDALYERLLQKYTVTTETRKPEATPATQARGDGQ